MALERLDLARHVDERRVDVQLVAYCAARRNVFRSPLPPTRIGGPPGVIGAGEFHAPVTEWCVPATVLWRSVNIALQIRNASSSSS